MKPDWLKGRSLFYLIPYIIVLIIGVWYRYSIFGLAFLDGDSEHYLMPPVLKTLTGQWHKGERPMQYLLFIYATLSYKAGIKYTIIAQQVLGITSASLLTLAWIAFVSGYKRHKLLWHLMGYLMLGIYISSPIIMNYEQFIGPESVCMCIMSEIICFMILGLAGGLRHRTAMIMLSIAIFLNLYLVNPLPKWIFVSVFLELVLLYRILVVADLSRKAKGLLTGVPHLLFILLIVVPEAHFKIDNPNEDRIYIEYQQMVYTHFDLLARDKTNFGMTPALQDSMMECYNKSKEHAYPLIGFQSDDLMWGRANNLIDQYFDHNYDSMGRYFIHLNRLLVTKYPLALSREIGKQVVAFYFSCEYVKKDLYGYYDVASTYPSNVDVMHQFDKNLPDRLNDYRDNYHPSADNRPKAYLLAPRYPASVAKGSSYDIERLPLLFSRSFIFFRHFHSLFILALFSFFLLRLYQRQLFQLHIITVLYVAMFVYVVTISIVHTFDIERFTTTIYPLILITPLLAIGYVGDFVLSRLQYTDGKLTIHFKDPKGRV